MRYTELVFASAVPFVLSGCILNNCQSSVDDSNTDDDSNVPIANVDRSELLRNMEHFKTLWSSQKTDLVPADNDSFVIDVQDAHETTDEDKGYVFVPLERKLRYRDLPTVPVNHFLDDEIAGEGNALAILQDKELDVDVSEPNVLVSEASTDTLTIASPFKAADPANRTPNMFHKDSMSSEFDSMLEEDVESYIIGDYSQENMKWIVSLDDEEFERVKSASTIIYQFEKELSEGGSVPYGLDENDETDNDEWLIFPFEM